MITLRVGQPGDRKTDLKWGVRRKDIKKNVLPSRATRSKHYEKHFVDRAGFEPAKIPKNQSTYHRPHLSRLAPSFGISQINLLRVDKHHIIYYPISWHRRIRTSEDSEESAYLPYAPVVPTCAFLWYMSNEPLRKDLNLLSQRLDIYPNAALLPIQLLSVVVETRVWRPH